LRRLLLEPVNPDIPVGTILMYAGDCRNSSVVLQLGMAGWLPCDGSELLKSDYPELYAAIGLAHGGSLDTKGYVLRFNLPNLIDRFARGVNGTAIDSVTSRSLDPDTDSRTPAAPNGNKGNEVGSYEAHGTARPVTTPIQLGSSGGHYHSASHLTADDHNAYHGTTKDMAQINTGTVTTPEGGAHQHAIKQGGDAITAPKNMALFHIIKYI
jgi:microcystin-dependent protein